jgi:hypothetical protein
VIPISLLQVSLLTTLQVTPASFIDAIYTSDSWYVIILVAFGWGIFDKYFRKKYILHIVQEEGTNLTEVKSFSKPLSWGGRFIEWKVRLSSRGQMDKKPIVREYKLDPKNVVFTDRWNKRHIIGSIDNTFAFHPYSDEEGKIKFLTIAKASADELGNILSKGGFMSRIEAIGQAISGNVNRNTLLMVGAVGIVLGMGIMSIDPTPFGLQHIIATTVTQTTTSTGTLGSTVSSIP